MSLSVALVITATNFVTAQVAPTSPAALTARAAAVEAPVVGPTTAAPGQASTATGKLPTRIKRPVVLQLKTTGTWSKAAKANTARRGAYHFAATAPTTAGTVTWRVTAPKVVIRSAGSTKTYKAITSKTTATKVISPTSTPTPTPVPTATPTPTSTATPTATPDTTPPPVPTGLGATPGNRAITLTWAPVTASDLAGYTVYQASSADGPWTVVSGTGPVIATNWTATSLTNGTAYWYAITASDTTGNQSAKSLTAAATPRAPDTTAPAVPTGLEVAPGDQSAVLTWSPVTATATDLVGYHVYLATSADGPWTQLTTTPQTSTTFTATGLTNSTTYWFAVTAVDTTGNESTRSVAVTETPENYTGPTHCGTLTRNETWGPTKPHVLDCTITIPAGITLTIKPGTTVKAHNAHGLTVQGTLSAAGTAEQPITFTSLKDDTVGGDTNSDGNTTAPSAGDWAGIEVSSGTERSVTLDHTRVSHATTGVNSGNPGARIRVTNTTFDTVRESGVLSYSSTELVVKDNDFTRFTGSSPVMYVQGGNLDLSNLTGNTGTDNPQNYASLVGTLTASTTWPTQGLSFQVPTGLDVAPGATLTLPAGTTLGIGGYRYNNTLNIRGSLITQGTAANPVRLLSWFDPALKTTTASNTWPYPAPNAGDWAGIEVSSGTERSVTLDHTRVSHATTGVNSGNPGARIRVTNTTFDAVRESGVLSYSSTELVVKDNDFTRFTGSSPVMYVQGGNLDLSNLTGNTGTDNPQNYASLVGTLTASTTWPTQGLSFQVPTGLDVAPGATLTLAAGTTLGIGGYRYNNTLNIRGSLITQGTAANPVRLLSWFDPALKTTTASNTWPYPAPNAGDWAGIEVSSGATAALAGVTIRYASTGLKVATGGAADVHGRILDTIVGIESSTFVDARNVDWGSPTGPGPAGDGTSIVGSGVLYYPWVGYVPPPRPATAAPQPLPPATDCADLVIYGLRGSDDDPQSPDETTLPDFSGTNGGFGNYNGQMAAALHDRLDELKPGLDVDYRAVQYLALPVPILGWFTDDYRRGVSIEEFMSSAFQGEDKLVLDMEAETTRCGEQTQFVILGYSQGAMSAHLALSQTMSEQQLARVAGVGLIADPAKVPNPEETLWEGEYAPARNGVRDKPGSLTAVVGTGDIGVNPIPASVVGRTISVCHQQDVVCAPKWDAWITNHLNYTPGGLRAMGTWLGTRVASRLP